MLANSQPLNFRFKCLRALSHLQAGEAAVRKGGGLWSASLVLCFVLHFPLTG